MLVFLYKEELLNDSKKIACVCVREEDGKIISEKAVAELFQLDEKVSDKWSWATLDENHFYDVLPDKYLIYDSLLDIALSSVKPDFCKLTIADFVGEPHVVSLQKYLAIVRILSYFVENPNELFDFPLYKSFCEEFNLEDYSVEDMIADMTGEG